MSEIKVKVSTNHGQVIGYFLDPKVEHLCAEDWQITGRFVDENGRLFEKVEFNPEAVPYQLDVSGIKTLGFEKLNTGFVQRGRQPVCMTAKKV